ncbi:ABC transporter permease [Bacteroidota bacterium]
MLRNYIVTSFRNILKTKVFTFINVIGLAIGMASCLLILQYVHFEYSYDKFHKNASNIYRVPISYSGSFESLGKLATNHPAVGPAMKQDFPEVLDFARLVPTSLFTKAVVMSYINESGEKISFNEESIYFTDSSFLSIYSFPFLYGDPNSALVNPASVVISESISRKYFRDIDPVGNTLLLNGGWPLKVTGVFKDIVENSHIKFDFLISFTSLGSMSQNSWKWPEYYTYVQLYPGTDPQQLEDKFPEFIDKYLGEVHKELDFQSHFSLQPITDIHLKSTCLSEPRATGNEKTVNFLVIIAFFILIIAWVNYVNLTSARSLERAREVGYRKIAGASKNQLIVQFLIDSLIINFIAIFLATIIAVICLPYFNVLSGQNIGNSIMDLELLREPQFWWLLVIVIISGAFIAGVYPAWLLSSFHPLQGLKGKFYRSGSGILIRKSLVLFQLIVSVFLIAGTLIVSKQLSFIRNKDLGYDKDQIMVLKYPAIWDSTTVSRSNSFKIEISRIEQVNGIATSKAIPGQILDKNSVRKKGTEKEENIVTFLTGVDSEYFKTYQMQLAAGRYFQVNDSSHLYNSDNNRVIVNEKLVELLGFKNPENVVGASLIVNVGLQEHVVTTIGVLKNFHQKNLKEDYEPILYFYPTYANRSYYSINLNTNQLSNTISAIKTEYQRLFTGNPFDYFFLDDFFDQQYRADQQFQKVFGVFSVLAIIVACLGLFGLTTLIMAQRTKEIGIRKVLGASVYNIVYLLSFEFIWLVVIGCIIASPGIFLWANNWLNNFAFRIDINWIIFIIPVILLLCISIITIAYQTIKAAIENPVNSLKYEG